MRTLLLGPILLGCAAYETRLLATVPQGGTLIFPPSFSSAAGAVAFAARFSDGDRLYLGKNRIAGPYRV